MNYRQNVIPNNRRQSQDRQDNRKGNHRCKIMVLEVTVEIEAEIE